MLISCDKVSKSFLSTDVFVECSFTMKENEKLAIIGPNGSGKTTLIKLLTNEHDPDSGRVIKSNKMTIGYLQQMAFDNLDQTVNDVFAKVFEKINALNEQIKTYEKVLKDNPQDVKTLNKYANLTNEFEMMGGYFIQSQMETIVSKMGFSKADMTKSIANFSGGEKTRLALAMLLLSYPDLLILDEPTNHLDLSMIEWLEGFLISYPKAVLFVSHDRRFIDKVAQGILAIEDYKIERYAGNYTHYLSVYQNQKEKQEKAYHQQQKEIKRLEALIEKFRYKKNKASFAQSKIKYLDKMEKIEKPKEDRRSLHMLFEPKLRGAKEVLICDKLEIGFDSVLAKVSFEIYKGQKIAIVGPNGVGKSTLLKTIAQQLQPISGHMIFGHQIQIGYFDQQLAQLNTSKSVLEELWDEHDQLTNTEIRKVLAQFQFYQDDVFKLVSQCSGGEKVRLTLAKLMLKKANFLVMDEPTNHLDIQAKEALEESLKQYSGTILFVSHDRYFVDALADTIWHFDVNQLIVEKKQKQHLFYHQQEKVNKQQAKQLTIEKRKEKKELEKLVVKMEKNITQAEEELESLRELRFDPDYYHDFEKMNTLDDQIDDKHNEIAHYMKQWEEAHQQLHKEENDEELK